MKEEGKITQAWKFVSGCMVKYRIIFSILMLIINVMGIISEFKGVFNNGEFSLKVLLAVLLHVVVVAVVGLLSMQGAKSIGERNENDNPFVVNKHIFLIIFFGIANSLLTIGRPLLALFLLIVAAVMSFVIKAKTGMDSETIVMEITEEIAISISLAVVLGVLLTVAAVAVGIVAIIVHMIIGVVGGLFVMALLAAAPPYDDRYYW